MWWWSIVPSFQVTQALSRLSRKYGSNGRSIEVLEVEGLLRVGEFAVVLVNCFDPALCNCSDLSVIVIGKLCSTLSCKAFGLLL